MTRKFLILSVAFVIASVLGGCNFINMAEEVSVLRVYSQLPPEITHSLASDFEKASKGKVKIELVGGTHKQTGEKNVSRASGDFDVWLGGTAEDYFLADTKKQLQPYQTKNFQNKEPALRDKHGAWTGLFSTNLVFVANRNALIEAGLRVPSSWQDLLQENFKDGIVFSEPGLRQGGFRFLTTLWQLFGENMTDDYLQKLKTLSPAYTESDAAAIEAVRTGKKAVTVVPLDLAMTAAISNNILVIGVPEEGTARIVIGAAIMNTTKSEALARNFMDFLDSESVRIILDNSDYYVWPLAEPPQKYTWGRAYSDVFLVNEDLRWSVLNSEEIADKLRPLK